MSKKIVLITGSNKGIGYQIAFQLGKLGHVVIVSARNPDLGINAVKTLKEKGVECSYVKLDVTDEQSIKAAASDIEKQYGRLDVLINNAGIFLDNLANPKKITEITLHDFRQTMDVNLFGVFSVTRAFLPLLKKSKSGKVINMSSDLGSLEQASDPGSKFDAILGASYRVSKAALNMLSLSFARELRGSNVTVNAVSPGWCQTELGTYAAHKTAAEGADTPVWLASQDEELFHGNFLCNRQKIAW
jgi:NAD(P)-dependent dehydrogenase (short-subunit alcohol dehydrogenase family)